MYCASSHPRSRGLYQCTISVFLPPYLTYSMTHSQIEQIWVFPLLYGLRMAWADTVDTEAPLENIHYTICFRTNAFSVYGTDKF